VNNPKLQGLFQSTKLLRDEYGFEAFYNIAITPWLQLTPDIQIVRGAQKEKITIGTTPGPSESRLSPAGKASVSQRS
jgi:Carbohydrate-selective porin, OprB family